MAVDGQPDTTIGRRRFWPGTFLFDPDTTDAGAGFKRFRPLVKLPPNRRTADGQPSLSVVSMENRDLRRSRDFAPWSADQYALHRQSFYQTVENLIHPVPRSAARIVSGRVDAFEEAVKRRVLAIENGRRYRQTSGGRVIEMPHGHDIFETTGPWEDYATPSRDMRLLVAIDDILTLPDRMEKSGAASAKEAFDAQAMLQRELAGRTIVYKASSGAAHTLTLNDVISRRHALEVAYNPNDCPEIRWGAAENTDEVTRCGYRAPEEQRRRMEEYRKWFQTRQRPARN
jgi:hypothetical protein